MTKDTPVEQRIEDLSLKDTQQKQQQRQKPFEIVLVDIEKAANGEIHCVKVPLEGNDEELKYVTLSYRWGEWQETLIDTKLGYTASVTSFDLSDFYSLCYLMTLESDFQDIKYVWVDAICVDQRPAKRKATIYQMSNIYERATYILAVPDLHLAYLKSTTINNMDIIRGSLYNSKYIYHLIHSNIDELNAMEEDFLDNANVPTNPILRHLLKNTLIALLMVSSCIKNIIIPIVLRKLSFTYGKPPANQLQPLTIKLGRRMMMSTTLLKNYIIVIK
ncbi:unnamed protein product [Absidia cylindrospora]